MHRLRTGAGIVITELNNAEIEIVMVSLTVLKRVVGNRISTEMVFLTSMNAIRETGMSVDTMTALVVSIATKRLLVSDPISREKPIGE